MIFEDGWLVIDELLTFSIDEMLVGVLGQSQAYEDNNPKKFEPLFTDFLIGYSYHRLKWILLVSDTVNRIFWILIGSIQPSKRHNRINPQYPKDPSILNTGVCDLTRSDRRSPHFVISAV